jgi:hypothetical protein
VLAVVSFCFLPPKPVNPPPKYSWFIFLKSKITPTAAAGYTAYPKLLN